MTRAAYRGYVICQQREFGPLRLLAWVEDGDFIVVKDGANAIPGATFRTIGDARRAVDALTEIFHTLATHIAKSHVG